MSTINCLVPLVGQAHLEANHQRKAAVSQRETTSTEPFGGKAPTNEGFMILYIYCICIYIYTPIDTYNTIVQCWICIYIYIYTLTNIAAILSTRQFQAEYQEIPQVQKRFSKAFQDLFWRLVHRPSCCARDFRARKGGIRGGGFRDDLVFRK